jgi:hypothetical protein
MGYFRFRKSFGILPGVHVNLSKTGVSTSVGGHGATLNVGHGKRTMTLGVPGTGLSYRAPVSGALAIGLVAAAAVIAVAWLLQPELVRQALHFWQPRWF